MNTTRMIGAARTVTLGAAVALLALASPARAMALRGFVIFGGGETIAHYAAADLSGDPELAAEVAFDDPALGYKYEYFSLFFLDLWTGGGEIVLYDQSSDRYVPLSDQSLLELTGRTPDSFGTPFLYRVPLGWLLLAIALALIGITTWRRMRRPA